VIKSGAARTACLVRRIEGECTFRTSGLPAHCRRSNAGQHRAEWARSGSSLRYPPIPPIDRFYWFSLQL